MSNTAEPRRRRSKNSTERLSQSVPDIHFDPNEDYQPTVKKAAISSHRPRRRASSPEKLSHEHHESSRSKPVSRRRSSDGILVDGRASSPTTTKSKSQTSRSRSPEVNKKRSSRKKPSSMCGSNSNLADAAGTCERERKTSTTSCGQSQQRPKKRFDESQETLSNSKSSMTRMQAASREGSRSSLNASQDLGVGHQRRSSSSNRRGSTGRSSDSRKTLKRRPGSGERSVVSTRSKGKGLDSQRRSSEHPEEEEGQHPKQSFRAPVSSTGRRSRSRDTTVTTETATTAATSSGLAAIAPLQIPVKTLGSKLYDVDRPGHDSIPRQAMAKDEVSVQSNALLLTKEQRVWKGIDDILDRSGDNNDLESIATRDVLPEPIAQAMRRERQRDNTKEETSSKTNDSADGSSGLPPLMNSSFSSLQSELTMGTAVTMLSTSKNYVVQPSQQSSSATSAANSNPMGAFLGSIAEHMLTESQDFEAGEVNRKSGENLKDSATLTRRATAEPVRVKPNSGNIVEERSTESSSGSFGIQEYYANKSQSDGPRKSHARVVHSDHGEDIESSDDDEDDQRYDPTIQAYGRASMPPKKPSASKSVDGSMSSITEMPPLMNSSFSSLQSEMTDIQSIISTAKNFVVKENSPNDQDDPMSAFLGRITNGLRARQMLVEEGVVEEVEDETSVDRETTVLHDLEETSHEKVDNDENRRDIPAEDELSGADRSRPDGDEPTGNSPGENEEGTYASDGGEEESSRSPSNNRKGNGHGENGAAEDAPPDTPGGLGSIPSLTSVSTINTHQLSGIETSADPLARWAANLRHELVQKMAAENRPLNAEEQELAEMEKALARAAEIAAEEKNETDITRLVLDEEIIEGIIEQQRQNERTKLSGMPRKKKIKKSPAKDSNQTSATKGARPANRPPPGRRKVVKKKKLPVKPLPAPAEEPENFTALYKEAPPEQITRPKPPKPVAAVKAVAKVAIPIAKPSKKEKYEQKSTLKSLKEKLQRLTFRRSKSSRRNSPTSVGGDEGKYFPRDNREEDENEEASFL